MSGRSAVTPSILPSITINHLFSRSTQPLPGTIRQSTSWPKLDSGIVLVAIVFLFKSGNAAEQDKHGYQPMHLHSTKYLQLGQPKPVVVSTTDNEVPPIEVVLAEPRDGKIINRLGFPVANANVSAYYGNRLCSSATTDGDGQFNLPKMPASIASDQATYRVHLENGVTFNSDNMSIESALPLVLKVGL